MTGLLAPAVPLSHGFDDVFFHAHSYWCPWDPTTGGQYQRKVSYHMICDPSVNGAEPFEALQNVTNECDYHLSFKSKFACASKTPIAPYRPPSGNSGKLSGGWIFVIIVLVLSVVYFGGGFLYTYQTERVWAPPNRQFWSAVGQYTSDGASFIGSGCKRRARPVAVRRDWRLLRRWCVAVFRGDWGPCLCVFSLCCCPLPYRVPCRNAPGASSAGYSASSYNAGSEAPKTAYTDL